MSFNIFDHLDKLEVVKETHSEYHCKCPICQDGGFKIDKLSGKYNSFKCGCMDTEAGKKAVINALAPKDNKKKALRPKQMRTWIYYNRDGQPLVRVGREDFGDGRTPKRWQERWQTVNSEQLPVNNSQHLVTDDCSLSPGKWVKGLKGIKREDLPIYRYQEVKEAIAQGKTIFIVEGEPCADPFWELGIPATTNIGGAGKWKPSDSADLAGAKVVLCPDRDKPGVKHMEAIAIDFPDAQWLYAFPNSPFWHNLPPSQGLDVADWIADYQLTAADIWEAVEPRREGLPNPNLPVTPPAAESKYTQKCVDALYSDKPWVALNGKLYFWTGIYYQEADVAQEKQRISQWCNTTSVQKGKRLTYSYATPSHVENIWKWLLLNKGVSANQVNPPGFNCLNGVVKINWNGRQASWQLVPHDPKVIYTYVSEIKFDPDADPSDCDRMLSCLEPAQQKLFIQTMAASLDLGTIRKYRGRKVKALLCKGHGNNGKDTLREAISLLYGGMGLADASISDFAAYDRGRKFDLAKLENARINWSSENSSWETLDRLQSLKKAITGEALDCECKGVDSRSMKLATVFLFNVNEAPNLKAGTEAIQSRWAVLEFNKTYKEGADPAKGEIEADSRFRYDPDFLKEKVCPALLNKMLEAIATLAIEGIDYSCTSEALSHIQQSTNHLWAFARDVGLDYLADGRVYINDLWQRLQSWYIDNGTLEIVTTDSGKEKKIWHDQPRRGDKNVKAPNQIKARFAELFPKIKWHKETQETDRKGQIYLSGIGVGESISEASEPISEATGEATNLSQQGSEASEPIWATPANLMTWLAELEPNARQIIISQINQTFSTSTEVPSTASLPHYPHTESAPASPTASPTASPLPHQGETDPQQSSEFGIQNEELNPNNSAAEDTRSALLTSNSELLIDWVRYQGQVWRVASQENGILKLRQSGFRKVMHTVHVSQVEIGGYKQR